MKPRISIIVAIDENRGIGKNGKIPWHLSTDLKRFKALTSGHTIIMGRKTWDSLPRKPLPDRINMIITRSPGFRVPSGVSISTSLEEALVEAEENEQEEIFIIGGAQIFQQALDMGIIDRLYLTKVEGDFDCDTFFPDHSEFKKVISEEEGEESGLKYKCINLEKKK